MGKNPHEVPNGFRNLRGAMALGHSIFCHTKMYRTDLNSVLPAKYAALLFLSGSVCLYSHHVWSERYFKKLLNSYII